MNVQAHALEVLEFERLLDHVAGHASSTPGAEHIRALRPRRVQGTRAEREDTLSELELELTRVSAMRALIEGEDGWRPEAVPELNEPIARLRVAGTLWSGKELLGALVLLQSSRRTLRALTDQKRPPAARAPLAEITAKLITREQLEKRLSSVLTEEGDLKDDASPALRRLRRELKHAEGDLVRLLERVISRMESHHRVDDASVTLRNGRYVVPVRREGRGALGGIVHDSSHSGQTLFVEPPAAIEAGNRIRELEAEEHEECERIFRELTESLRPEREDLKGALDALTVLDSLYGRARYAIQAECAPAHLALARDGFVIRIGRHPLLLAQGKSGVVPFDLEMSADERTLLVSGPNTGGKTVLLKALALCSMMVQSGIPAPVGPESNIPCFDDFFADIGDEQSLEASLSTFSAHLRRLTEILEKASPDALVLIDELGSGTDPLEGGALGGAIIEELTRRGSTTIATTHLGALKELASEVPGVVNASLQFDSQLLAPTYKLIKGIPGRSYGLAIAQRLNMPTSVLMRAEERVPQLERDLSALLADVEQRSTDLAVRERDATNREDRAQSLLERTEERERSLKERERALEREARKEARRYLLDARQAVERTIQELKAASARASSASGRETGLSESDAQAARRGIERLAAGEKAGLEALDAELLGGEGSGAGRDGSGSDLPLSVRVGDAVSWSSASLGDKTGKVLELRGGDAVVAVGALKLTVPLSVLNRVPERYLKGERGVPAVAVAMGDSPEIEARTEVDVRGMRVHEVDDAVQRALDGAVRADLGSLRIIHGKGTGALRERVSMLLRADERVKSYRLGAWNEGGAGVTVAELT